MPRTSTATADDWAWLDTLDGPHALTDENLRDAYRLRCPFCTQQHRGQQKKNPFCLHNLGEKKWVSGAKLEQAIKAVHDLAIDQRRKPENLVGLVNLGATCYVNSLLQIWFHNPRLRRAVLAARVSDSSSDALALLELQRVFCFMAMSQRRCYTPSSLIDALKLPRKVQQDAQEFLKLFTALLEGKLSHLEDDSKDVLSEYNGLYTYRTTCHNCMAESDNDQPFVELQLPIKGHSSLEEALHALLQQEVLDEKNKYFCSYCQSKHTASRGVVFKKLPDTLLLVLLRFVFDLQTLNKKKLNHAVSFPESLDLSFMTHNKDDVYSLQAVLLHRGNSAHSGHYITQARVPENGPWVTFDDDDVQIMDSKAQIGHVPSLYETVSGTAKKPKASKRPAASDETSSATTPSSAADAEGSSVGRHRSTSIYVLAYRRTSLLNSSQDDTSETDVTKQASEQLEAEARRLSPADIVSAVDADNHELNAVTSKAAQEAANKEQQLKHLNHAIASVAKPWDSVQDDSVDMDATEWVPTAWLQSLFKVDLQAAVGASPQVEVLGTDDSDVQIIEDTPEKSSGPPNTGPFDGAAAFGPSQTSLPPLDTTTIGCPHGRMDPLSLDKAKLLPRQAVVHLESGVKLDAEEAVSFQLHRKGPTLIASNSVCRECVKELFMSRQRKALLKTVQTEVSRALKQLGRAPAEPSDCVWVAKTALRDFERMNAESAPRAPFNWQSKCEHGQRILAENHLRLVPQSLWRQMAQFYDDAIGFPSDRGPCHICVEEHSKFQESAETAKEMALAEKSRLMALFRLDRRPVVHELLLSAASERLVVLPTLFSIPWRKFIRPTVKSCLEDRPRAISTESLLCKHGRFVFDINQDMHEVGRRPKGLPSNPSAPRPDDAVSFELIYEDEWKILGDLYSTNGQAIYVFRQDNELASDPPCCHECRKLRLEEEMSAIDFSNQMIYVQRKDKPEPDAEENGDTASGNTETEPASGPASQETAKTNAAPALVRRSSRNLTKGSRRVKVSSTDTVMDLKIKLLDLFGDMPIDQHLFLEDGRELADGSRTLGSYLVTPRSVLTLRVDQASSFAARDDGPKSVELGFQGTFLVGASRTKPSSSAQPPTIDDNGINGQAEPHRLSQDGSGSSALTDPAGPPAQPQQQQHVTVTILDDDRAESSRAADAERKNGGYKRKHESESSAEQSTSTLTAPTSAETEAARIKRAKTEAEEDCFLVEDSM